MNNVQIRDTIRGILNIKKDLVGIKAWPEEPQAVPKYQGNAFPGICTQIGEVLAKGTTFYTNQEHCFCTGGIVATGIVQAPSEEKRNEMLEAHFAISKAYKDMETAIHYEDLLEKIRLPVKQQNAAVQLGLFKDLENPDVVLIFCTPGAADILNRAYTYTTGKPVQGFGGNGACPFAIQYPYVTRTPSFTYSDVAWRAYIGLSEEELTVSFPYEVLIQFIENLPSVAEAYRKYGEIPEE